MNFSLSIMLSGFMHIVVCVSALSLFIKQHLLHGEITFYLSSHQLMGICMDHFDVHFYLILREEVLISSHAIELY